MRSPKRCIARRLKEARLAFGISQKKLGMLAGIDEHSASARMNQYETGRHVPNFLTLQHISKVLGYPVAFFTSEDDLIAELVYWIGQLRETDKHELLRTVKKLVSRYQEAAENKPNHLDFV